MRGLIEPLDDAAIDRAFGFIHDDKLAIAVSGGSDSMALLRLAQGWAARRGVAPTALTVDHRLRVESADEARQVADFCNRLAVPHKVLVWEHDAISGNLSRAGREARYRLMADYCADAGIDALATGHTLDDQAETVLMRLARGSGVDGLAAMARETRLWGIRVMRPLLDVSRETLREYLRALGQEWIEDPTNDDPTYDRIKARAALKALAPLGVMPDRLSRTARMMRLAREALERQATEAMHRAAVFSPLGYVRLDTIALRQEPREIALRVLATLLCAVSGTAHRPRLDPLDEALDWALDSPKSGGRTLHGCLLRPHGSKILVIRETNACTATVFCASKSRDATAFDPELPEQVTRTWDARFRVILSGGSGTIAPLGDEGLAQIPDCLQFSKDWNDAPYKARLALPGLWQDESLVACAFTPHWAFDAPVLKATAIWPASCEEHSNG